MPHSPSALDSSGKSQPRCTTSCRLHLRTPVIRLVLACYSKLVQYYYFCKMIEEGATIIEELLLHDEDFPEEYVHMAHPGDYKAVQEFKPQFIMHSHFGRHNRLIARVAWKTGNGTVLPMSFICNTGAPSHIYLSGDALRALDGAGLLLKDDEDMPYAKIHANRDSVFSAAIELTPQVHKSANILGLKSLKRLHLRLTDDGFSFDNEFEYL